MSHARIRQIISWRPGQLARNTVHAGGWNAVRIGLQAASLVFMARVLGAEGYGALAGTVALYVTFAQFSGMGSGISLVRHLSRAGELHAQLRATQWTYLVTGAALFAVAWPLSVWWLGASLHPFTLGVLAAAEIVVAPALLPLAYRYQAEERMFISGAILTLAPVARFGAVASALLLDVQEIAPFAALYFGWLSVTVALTLYQAWPRNKVLTISAPSLRTTIREGMPYAVSGAATTAGSELDKTVLLRAGGEAVAGQYAAAYRVMQAATLPVNSLILAAVPRLFRQGHQTTPPIRGALLTATLVYAAAAALALTLIAPLVPLILGTQFAASEQLLRGLCFVVVTSSIRQLVTAHLTATDQQKYRNFAEITGLIASLGFLLTLVPSLGPWGAIIAIGVADSVVIFLGFLRLAASKTRC